MEACRSTRTRTRMWSSSSMPTLPMAARSSRYWCATGTRVVICARHASDLTKMLHGYDADRVMAIAADTTDPRQLRELCRRATDRFGTVTTILDTAGRQMPHLRLAS